MGKLKVETHRNTASLDALREEWNPLLQRGATNTLFLTWEWQIAWWEAFGAGRNLYVVDVRDDDGALVGIAPLFHQESLVDPAASLPALSVERPVAVGGGELKRTVHFVGGTEVSDYLDIIAPAERNGEVCAALLDTLETHFPAGPRSGAEGFQECPAPPRRPLDCAPQGR